MQEQQAASIIFGSRCLRGGLRAGRATPKLPLPLHSAAFARPPTLGNAGLAGEASAPSHRNYRLPWGSGASCNNSLVSRGLRVIMGWTQPSQHTDPGMSPQPVPAPRPWLWVPSGLSVCPFIPGPAELRRRIPQLRVSRLQSLPLQPGWCPGLCWERMSQHKEGQSLLQPL